MVDKLHIFLHLHHCSVYLCRNARCLTVISSFVGCFFYVGGGFFYGHWVARKMRTAFCSTYVRCRYKNWQGTFQKWYGQVGGGGGTQFWWGKTFFFIPPPPGPLDGRRGLGFPLPPLVFSQKKPTVFGFGAAVSLEFFYRFFPCFKSARMQNGFESGSAYMASENGQDPPLFANSL